MGESIPSAVMDSPVHVDVGLGPNVPYSAVHSGRPNSMSVDVPFQWREDTRPRDTTGYDAQRDQPRKYYLDERYGKIPVYHYNWQGMPKIPRIVDSSHPDPRKPTWFHGTAQQWHAAITGGYLDLD